MRLSPTLPIDKNMGGSKIGQNRGLGPQKRDFDHKNHFLNKIMNKSSCCSSARFRHRSDRSFISSREGSSLWGSVCTVTGSGRRWQAMPTTIVSIVLGMSFIPGWLLLGRLILFFVLLLPSMSPFFVETRPIPRSATMMQQMLKLTRHCQGLLH